MGKTAPPIVAPCAICKTAFTLPLSKRAYWRKTGRAICSPECRKAAYTDPERAHKPGPTAEGRARLAELRRTQNPMKDPATRAKVSAALRALGHRPPTQGGNGRGTTEPQQLLFAALGRGWLLEYVVKPGEGRKRGGLPTHFKLDIANPDLMVAVEVDGKSHCSQERQEQDRRKTAWLNGAGWTVLRFSNEEVMADTAACARTVTSTTSKLSAHTLIS